MRKFLALITFAFALNVQADWAPSIYQGGDLSGFFLCRLQVLGQTQDGLNVVFSIYRQSDGSLINFESLFLANVDRRSLLGIDYEQRTTYLPTYNGQQRIELSKISNISLEDRENPTPNQINFESYYIYNLVTDSDLPRNHLSPGQIENKPLYACPNMLLLKK